MPVVSAEPTELVKKDGECSTTLVIVVNNREKGSVVSHQAFRFPSRPCCEKSILTLPTALYPPFNAETDFKRVAYFRKPYSIDPLGAKVSKKWGRKVFHGALLERFVDKNDGLHYRWIYEDGEVRHLSVKYVGSINVILED